MFEWLERAIVRNWIRKQVRQSPVHDLKIRSMYSMIRAACDEEFTEDNVPTRDAHLREQFESTQARSTYTQSRLVPWELQIVNKGVAHE